MSEPRPIRIAVLDDYQRVAQGMTDWGALAPAEISVFHDTPEDREILIERLAPFDILVLMRERTAIDAALIAALPRLRMIATPGQANAAIDLAACAARGIVVSGTGVAADAALAVATFAWTLVLAITRGLTANAQAVRAGGWQTDVGVDIEGKTLGLLGLGRVGRQMASLGPAFGMKVIAWSQNLDAATAAQVGAERVEKDELFARADVLSVHVRLSDRTRGLVDADALARMKPGAYLVNTSRGPIVDEAALVSALESRRIAGAALDVFDIEPLPADHPFRRLDNVLATPHIGYVTQNGYRAWHRDMAEDIGAFLAGAPIRRIDGG